jgi:hypothetical protein
VDSKKKERKKERKTEKERKRRGEMIREFKEEKTNSPVGVQ